MERITILLGGIITISYTIFLNLIFLSPIFLFKSIHRHNYINHTKSVKDIPATTFFNLKYSSQITLVINPFEYQRNNIIAPDHAFFGPNVLTISLINVFEQSFWSIMEEAYLWHAWWSEICCSGTRGAIPNSDAYAQLIFILRFDTTCKYNLKVANGYSYNSVRCKNVTDATLRPHKMLFVAIEWTL